MKRKRNRKQKDWIQNPTPEGVAEGLIMKTLHEKLKVVRGNDPIRGEFFDLIGPDINEVFEWAVSNYYSHFQNIFSEEKELDRIR